MTLAPTIEALDRILEAASDLSRVRLVASLQAALTRAFRRMSGRFVSGLRAARLRSTPAGWVGWQGAFDRAVKATRKVFERAFESGIAAALQHGHTATLVDFGADRLKEGAASWISSHIAAYVPALVTGILDTTRSAMDSLFSSVLAAGASVRDAIQAAADRFREFWTGTDGAQARTETIAAAETGTAVNVGALQAARELVGAGANLEKSWVTMQDDRVERHCLDNEAAGWIGVLDAFPSGSQAPLDHPRCRCRLGWRRKE